MISIIVSLYNDEQSILSFSQSLKKQQVDKKYECIFVDNGSRDQTLKILRTLCKQDFHFHYISFHHNMRLHESLFIATSFAQGDYIMTMNVMRPPYMIKTFYDMLKYKNIAYIGGVQLMHNHSCHKQRYFKMYQRSIVSTMIETKDFDSFRSFIKKSNDDIIWMSFTDLETKKKTFFERIFNYFNMRFEKRMIVIVLFVFISTIVCMPLCLICQYHLEHAYSYYVALLFAICTFTVVEITHSRYCCFHLRKRGKNIKETTFR